MATNYNTIAKEYQLSKMSPWRLYVELYTYFDMLGDLSGLKILDLACGDGFYTRQLKRNGAAHVVGIDISSKMIQLAQEIERNIPTGNEYHVCDVLDLDLNEEFDLVCASYLLNYAQSANELIQMTNVIAKHLKPEGQFITINSNPDFKGTVGTMSPYGFTRENMSYTDGAEILYRFYQPNGSYFEVINYHHSKSTHEVALTQTGFSNIKWHALKISPQGNNEFGPAYWVNILKNQPVIGLSCKKHKLKPSAFN